MSANDFVGVWRLVSYVCLDDIGKAREGPLGPSPEGLLIYDANGHMLVSMMRVDGDDPPARPPAETFMGYAGQWRLSGDQVRHDVMVSAHPHQVNTELIRDFTLDGDRLVLCGTALIDGKPRRRMLTWQRVVKRNNGRTNQP